MKPIFAIPVIIQLKGTKPENKFWFAVASCSREAVWYAQHRAANRFGVEDIVVILADKITAPQLQGVQ